MLHVDHSDIESARLVVKLLVQADDIPRADESLEEVGFDCEPGRVHWLRSAGPPSLLHVITTHSASNFVYVSAFMDASAFILICVRHD